MNHRGRTTPRAPLLRAPRLRGIAIAPALLALGLLGACGDDDNDIAIPAPTPSPIATTPPPQTTFDVGPCLNQTIPGTGGLTVAGAVIPDTLKLDLAAASGFPNGRRLPDPVIDVTLAAIFLDLTTESPLRLAQLPLNPPANDLAFQESFPFLAAPQGTPVLAPATGSNFTFRSDPASAYVRVDRMGMPAVSTALIGSDQKLAYNDADPAVDASGTFVPELTRQLTVLTNALADDLVGAGLRPCAKAQQ